MTKLHTEIWLEEAEPHRPFAARAAFCHGYDVYGQMLGNAQWMEMLYLLFRGEAPSDRQLQLLNALGVALANAGPRDPSVHAAMCSGVSGSTAAASLMAALAVGAGQVTGAREVLAAMQAISSCGTDISAWTRYWSSFKEGSLSSRGSIWPPCDHLPGFDIQGKGTTLPVLQTLACLRGLSNGPHLPWLHDHRVAFEAAAGDRPLALTGVAAAALMDLGFTPEQGEMLFLLLRLPGAAAHALEQNRRGYKSFPFFEVDLLDDPEKNTEPPR